LLVKRVTFGEGEWAHETVSKKRNFEVTVNSLCERVFIEDVGTRVLRGKRQRVKMMPRGYDDTCRAVDGWYLGWRRKFLR